MPCLQIQSHWKLEIQLMNLGAYNWIFQCQDRVTVVSSMLQPTANSTKWISGGYCSEVPLLRYLPMNNFPWYIIEWISGKFQRAVFCKLHWQDTTATGLPPSGPCHVLSYKIRISALWGWCSSLDALYQEQWLFFTAAIFTLFRPLCSSWPIFFYSNPLL